VQPTGLPIEPVLPELARALDQAGAAVLQAPPGAGKTTLVPLALLDQPWLAGRKILLLEPRRLATRAAARRMAELRGERLGATVGYRIRRETSVGPATRIEVVTEGILTRMLQDDPALETAGLVIFDEFHERSLHADLGLALALESRAVLRPDLRILVMSATLEGAPVARLLGNAPIVTSEGRGFPIETRYLPPRPGTRIEAAVASAVLQALSEESGDVLAFLPGQGEIRRTAELLQAKPGNWSLHPLYGNLSQGDQDAAIRPALPGRRKVVLATAIAETSLTIEGVRVVIDAGLARVPKFSPGSGMTRLVTVRVSRASADQRRGRAGRTVPGVCYRLWAAAEDPQLLPRSTPEILEADLAPLALELAVSGVREPNRLGWLDLPPAAAIAEAQALLRQLGALDRDGVATPHGRRMAGLGTHPRLAHLLLRGAGLGGGLLAAQLTALLEERDILRGTSGSPDADIQLRLELLAGGDTPPVYHGWTVDRVALQRVRDEARAWRKGLGRSVAEPPSAGVLLAFAYPDRIGQRRAGQAGRFLLRNGQGASTDSPTLARADFLVAAELDGDRRESRLWLGATITEEEIVTHFGDQIEVEENVGWDERAKAVVAARRKRLGAIILSEKPLRDPDPEVVRGAFIAWLRRAGLGVLPWSEGAVEMRQRLAFLHQQFGAPWLEVSDQSLLDSLEEWLGPQLGDFRRRADLSRLDVAQALLGILGRAERRALDDLAPTHLPVPSGSLIRVRYADPGAPFLAVRLQELFGLTETPRVGGGRVPVTLHLLSPAQRPLQVTRDLAGFWRTSYFDVRKDMRGRYPRHYWPDDPLIAEPTRKAKRKK
jgi:ATP-dependent helicase HrpB